jgi:transcriptional regulator with XRE-family HTH domain
MTNEENKYQFIGKKIREAREASGLSQKQLAEKIGYETSTAVSYIESGERKVSIVDLEKISNLLDRDIRFFLGLEVEQQNVRVALRAESNISEKDQHAILHIIDMAKKRAKDNGGNK